MTESGYRFRTLAPRPHAECGVCSKETPGELVARLAMQKAADVRQQLGWPPHGGVTVSDEIILACDTVAECQGQILGKPADERHAERMLRALSGREHHVYSGLCLWPAWSANPQARVARSTLYMRPARRAAIARVSGQRTLGR